MKAMLHVMVYVLPDILAKLGLSDHLKGVISCLGCFADIVPESISHYFQLWLGSVSVEEVGIAACWTDRRTT